MSNPHKFRVAVIGASGYGGFQAVRLLNKHPNFTVSSLCGKSTAGLKWNDLHPYFPLEGDKVIEKPDVTKISEDTDFVILSLPNTYASKLVPDLLRHNLRIIDLSADYRYRSLDEWKQVYVHDSNTVDRNDYDLCSNAIYGLPEWNKSRIKSANLIAAPGCFPTASLLALLPFLKQGLIDTEGLIIDAKSGTSGGGKNPKEHLMLSESSEGISPYSVIGHRHTSEIEQQATEVAGHKIQLQFIPHLVPMVRGILVTAYARLRDPGLTAEDCSTVLKAIYKHSPCINVLPVGKYPSTKWSRYTNMAHLSVQVDARTGRIVIMNAIDNLFKGQAAQAIQCLNIMSGISEEVGLPLVTHMP